MAHTTQGFRDSPAIVDEAVHEDLDKHWAQNTDISLLQSVDDLRAAAAEQETCLPGTKQLL